MPEMTQRRADQGGPPGSLGRRRVSPAEYGPRLFFSACTRSSPEGPCSDKLQLPPPPCYYPRPSPRAVAYLCANKRAQEIPIETGLPPGPSSSLPRVLPGQSYLSAEALHGSVTSRRAAPMSR